MTDDTMPREIDAWRIRGTEGQWNEWPQRGATSYIRRDIYDADLAAQMAEVDRLREVLAALPPRPTWGKVMCAG